jgi:oligopeptide transport system substrate-binding protein
MDRRLATCAIALVLVGCGHPDFSRTTHKDNVFHVPLDVPLMSLDPALESDSFSIDVVQNTFQGLVSIGEDNQPHPCLATSWDIAPDGKTYTFHLRPNVRFQSGRTFEATDVKRSIERATSSAVAAPLAADYLSDIVGVRLHRDGKSDQVSGIEVVDPVTVRITLDARRPYFIAKLTCPAASIVDCQAIKDGLHIKSVAEMQGTGPFRIEKYVEGQMLVQRAFDGYWGGKPKIDGIERPVMRDEAERIAAYKRGEIDMIPQLARSNYASFMADPQLKDQLKLLNRATLIYLALNTRAWPDRRIRYAIAQAIDNEEIARDTMLGTVTPARSIVPVGIPGHTESPSTWPAHDPSAAKDAIGKKTLPVLHVTFPMDNPDLERIADRIGSQIHSATGIAVKLDRMDTATLVSKQNKGELDCVVSGWFADYMDPQDFLSMLLMSSSPENHWFYSNRELDRLCGQADIEQDQAKRLALYRSAEELALADAVLIPICYWKMPAMISPRVHGVRSYAGQYLPYDSVTLDR